MKTFFRQLSFALLVFVGVSATAATRYVDLNSPNPTSPYSSWSTAATNIQDAIDVANLGDEILVTNGVYRTGGTAVSPSLLTNRVAVNKIVKVRSVNGPSATIIEGYRVPGTDLGTNAIRCVYLKDGALLNGFTLTNGGTMTGSGSLTNAGGGVYCETTNAMVLSCVLSSNAAVVGGGAYSGTLSNSSVLQNTATSNGGGAANSILRNSSIKENRAGSSGGGVTTGTLINCYVANNSSAAYGGGAYNSSAINAAIYGNSAGSGGGIYNQGTYAGRAVNCTIVGNSAGEGGGVNGISYWSAVNCIIYYNRAMRYSDSPWDMADSWVAPLIRDGKHGSRS